MQVHSRSTPCRDWFKLSTISKSTKLATGHSFSRSPSFKSVIFQNGQKLTEIGLKLVFISGSRPPGRNECTYMPLFWDLNLLLHIAMVLLSHHSCQTLHNWGHGTRFPETCRWNQKNLKTNKNWQKLGFIPQNCAPARRKPTKKPICLLLSLIPHLLRFDLSPQPCLQP